MIKTYKSPKTTLLDDEVFVFGSNSENGFHGAGSAGFATFGETGNVWRQHNYQDWPKGTKGRWNVKGQSEGPMLGTEGKSYAIPTVTRAGAKRSIPLSEIKKSIEKFYAFAESRPHLKFFVAQENKVGLNGYEPKELASIYSGNIPENVYFDEGFASLLNIIPESHNIVHCKKGEFTEYIGRGKAGSVWRWGNPFVIGRNSDRETVIARYKTWLETGESFGNVDATPERRRWILDHVHELKDETLGCWCDYPKEDCHGRILKEFAARIAHTVTPIKQDIYSGKRVYQCECGEKSSFLNDASELDAFVKDHQGLKTLAVIGTAGRKDDYNKLTANHYWRMVDAVLAVIKKENITHLVSGGAAWSDWTIYEIPDLPRKTYLPENPKDLSTAKYYHDRFFAKVSNVSEPNGEIVHHGGFLDRNLLVAKDADMFLAMTFGNKNEVKDGGTKHTVNAMLKQGKSGYHLDLNDLKLYIGAK